MSNIDPIDELLQRFLADVDDSMEFMGSAFKSKERSTQQVQEALNQAKSKIQNLILDIIGEDEPLVRDIGGSPGSVKDFISDDRNQLRAEQRAKLTATYKLDKE